MPWQPFRRKGNKHRPLTEVRSLSFHRNCKDFDWTFPAFFVCLLGSCCALAAYQWPPLPFLYFTQKRAWGASNWPQQCAFQDEDETSFAQEMTVPRSYSDGNLVRSVSWKENLKLNLNIFGLAGHQVNGCCWEIGLHSAATAHALGLLAIGPVSQSEY